ncbi:MAG: DNA methyltransferase [Candidatus Nanopelagicales bacterium]|nr:DNA methyltransferase [Candidatus Nanopelagicales bacterium]
MADIVGDDNSEAAMFIANFWKGPLAMFFSPYAPFPIAWRSILVWSKGGHVGIGGDRETCWKRDFELIGIRDNAPLSGGRDSAVLHYNAVSPPPSGHVAEKPIALMLYLVSKLSNIGDLILDPFMGSGRGIQWVGELALRRVTPQLKSLFQ